MMDEQGLRAAQYNAGYKKALDDLAARAQNMKIFTPGLQEAIAETQRQANVAYNAYLATRERFEGRP